MVTLDDRYRGLMVGIAIGDALGRPVEGHRQVSESYIEEIMTRPPSLSYTDDTAMAISVAESLLACDGFDGADMARRFADTYFDEPWRGYGSGVIDVFERVHRGANWAHAASRQFDGAGSYGNGAAMRVAPVALWSSDPGAVKEMAADTARVTHTHPIGVDGAVVQALAASHAVRDFSTPLLVDLAAVVETDEFRAKLGNLDRALERGDEYARLHLGNWVSAHNSVVTALYCFLQSDGFEETVLRAIRIGGDTDTIAAMAGALAGARFGIGAVPPVWRGVEGYERMVRLADRIFHLNGEEDGR